MGHEQKQARRARMHALRVYRRTGSRGGSQQRRVIAQREARDAARESRRREACRSEVFRAVLGLRRGDVERDAVERLIRSLPLDEVARFGLPLCLDHGFWFWFWPRRRTRLVQHPDRSLLERVLDGSAGDREREQLRVRTIELETGETVGWQMQKFRDRIRETDLVWACGYRAAVLLDSDLPRALAWATAAHAVLAARPYPLFSVAWKAAFARGLRSVDAE